MAVVRKFLITIIGVALVALGVALTILPGPGILLIVGGLALLATEYVWARRLLVKAKKQAQDVQQAAVSSPLRTAASVAFALAIVALGAAMLIVEDVAWPVWDQLLDRVWGDVTGGILVVTGLVLLATTYVTIRTARGEETTHTRKALRPTSAGATRVVGG